MEIVINAAPVTKKNSQRIVVIKGRPMILPSKQYADYEKVAVRQIRAQIGDGFEALDGCYNVKCLFYMATKRKTDLTNLLEAADDVLVRAGVLSDDNNTVVGAHDGSRVLYDKARPRTEIEIMEFIL